MENIASKLRRGMRYLGPELRANAVYLIARVDEGEVLSDWEVGHLLELWGTVAAKAGGMYAVYLRHAGEDAVLLLDGLYAAEGWGAPRLFETRHAAEIYADANGMGGARHAVRRYAGGTGHA